jgi:hypothetical protein
VNTKETTPLRIAENIVIVASLSPIHEVEEERQRIKNLLRRYGAKSLHLFPHKHLPGYVEEDILASLEDTNGEAIGTAESEYRSMSTIGLT